MTGGAEDEFERLLAYFSKKKEQYEIHCLCPDGPRAEVYSRYCSKTASYKYGHLPVIYENISGYVKYLVKSVFQIFQVMKFAYREKYDLTVINVVVLLWPALAMKMMGSKVVIFIREDVYPPKVRYFLYWLLSKTCNYFIPNSITKKKDFISATNNQNIKHIYPAIENDFELNKVELNEVIPLKIYQKLIDKNTFKFINPARILKKKNQLLILKALNIMRNSGIEQMPFVFFLGYYDMSSNYMQLVTKYIKDNALGDYCFFLGELNRGHLYRVYEHVNATIISSLSEGLPLVLVESFKFKKPVISTKVGGIPEIITDSVNGFLVDFDAEKLANAMKKIINDKDLYNNITSNAFATYINNFDLDVILNETENIFRYVIDEKNK